MCITICYHTYVLHDERTDQGKLVIQLDQQMFYQPKRNNEKLIDDKEESRAWYGIKSNTSGIQISDN